MIIFAGCSSLEVLVPAEQVKASIGACSDWIWIYRYIYNYVVSVQIYNELLLIIDWFEICI